MTIRRTLRRWHLWLGWLVGVPMLFWTLSGVMMVIRPIDEVRGRGLLRPLPPVSLTAPPVVPALTAPVERLALEPRVAGPRWVIDRGEAGTGLADPATGKPLPPLGADEARREVLGRYTGKASVVSVRATTAKDPPLEFRRPQAAWQVEMSDGTRFYVDPASGEVLATRTRWWRFYDWMWGLHIMDLETREDSHNNWLVGFGLLALVTTLMALVLLPLSSRRRRSGERVPKTR